MIGMIEKLIDIKKYFLIIFHVMKAMKKRTIPNVIVVIFMTMLTEI